MSISNSKKNSYLVFKRKEASFDIPDNFPEDKIPKFLTEIDFKKWYKEQGFKNLKIMNVKDYKSEPIIDPYVLDLEENNETYNSFYNHFPLKKRIHTIKSFIKNLNKNKHLIVGDLLDTLSAIDPLDYLNLLRLNLTAETYEKFKVALINKYSNKTIIEILKPHLTLDLVDKSSEQFVEFLNKEKITLKGINFLDLDFHFPEKLIDAISLDDWGRFNPPFSLRKMELLLEMCEVKETKENQMNVLKRLTYLIESNSFEKLKLLISQNVFSKTTIKFLLKTSSKIPNNIMSQLLSVLNK
jgi:hypothetical protein